MDNSWKEYRPQDFRFAISGVQKELDELSLKRTELMKERRTMQTVMYVMFPEEALKDGYMSATSAIARRLVDAKSLRELSGARVRSSALMGDGERPSKSSR